MRDDELDTMLAALTSVEPDPEFASRVLREMSSTLDISRRRKMGPWGRSWFGVVPVATALALLFLAIGIIWRASGPIVWPPVGSAPSMGIADALPPAPAQELVPGDELVGRASAQSRVRRAAHAFRGEDQWPNRLPALERSAALAIDPIERTAIHQEEIRVHPLSIAPLEIESLDR